MRKHDRHVSPFQQLAVDWLTIRIPRAQLGSEQLTWLDQTPMNGNLYQDATAESACVPERCAP